MLAAHERPERGTCPVVDLVDGGCLLAEARGDVLEADIVVVCQLTTCRSSSLRPVSSASKPGRP